MARSRRRLARYKKTGLLIAGTGVALGLAAVLLWPQLMKLFRTPLITVGKPTIRPVVGPAAEPDDEIDESFVDSLPYQTLIGGI